MGNLFQKAKWLVAIVLAVVDAVAKATDISGAKDRQRREVFTFAPASLPVVDEPAPAIPVAALAFDAEPAPEPTPEIAPEQPLPPTVIASPSPVVVEELVPKIAVPLRPPISLDEAKKVVLEMFDEYVSFLSKGEFKLAWELQQKIRYEKVDGHSLIWVLEQLVDVGLLDEEIPEGVKFSWKEGEKFSSSSSWEEVPAKKRATTLLFALRQWHWDEAQAERQQRAQQPYRPYVNPVTGFAGNKTGKTQRDKAKAKGPKPERVGPAKGHNATPPKHGSKKKRA